MPEKIRLGIGITGSFCTFDKIFREMENLVSKNMDITSIFSYNAYSIDTRFGKASDFVKKAEEITNKKVIHTIEDAEVIGPGKLFDVLLIAPCTGNTLAKLAAGITDTPVLMAAKSHLRNNRPVVIFISSNDSLSTNLKNIGCLITRKNIYFVPFSQDDYAKKPNSMISKPEYIYDTILSSLNGIQQQPVLAV